MFPVKALLVAAPLVLAGAGGAWRAHGRVGMLRAELAAVDARGKAEGDSYLRTLQGAHAERQPRSAHPPTRRGDGTGGGAGATGCSA